MGAAIMKRRQAFTLVELMVSMALIIFIMSILSQAFVAALGVFRNLKGQGDLAEKLRSTTQILQRDLGAYHFEGNKRISDPTFWNNGPPQQGFFQVWHGSPPLPLPAVIPAVPASYIEGFDTDGIASFLTTNHAMAFTIRLAGNNMGDVLSASAAGSGNVWNPLPLPTGSPVVPQLPGNPTPPGPSLGLGIGAIQTFGPPESRYQPILGTPSVSGYNYQWGEVAWFLYPQKNPNTGVQDTTVPDAATGAPATPLWTLDRRQRLLVPDNNLVSLATIPQGATPPGVPNGLIGNFMEMSCWTGPNGNIYFNSPVDITVPPRRFGYNPVGNLFPPSAFTPIPAGNALSGSDIQLNDVVSFDIRLLPMYPVGTAPPSPDPFVTLSWPGPTTVPPSTNNPFNNGTFTYTAPLGIAAPGAVFDTWSSVLDGIHDYSKWNIVAPATPGTTIPFWTLTPLIYQYPGTLPSQTITTPVTGSGPIIKAIQITIRIWDFKTNQTRQVTIVQAM
jgi:type II secretory pathway pseudopilin PulG